MTATGTVRWFNDAKGFGFITPDAGGDDVFVKFPQINMPGRKTLREGQKVSYEAVQGPIGLMASNVMHAVSADYGAVTANEGDERYRAGYRDGYRDAKGKG